MKFIFGLTVYNLAIKEFTRKLSNISVNIHIWSIIFRIFVVVESKYVIEILLNGSKFFFSRFFWLGW